MRAEARRGTCAARGAVHTCRQVHTSFRGSAGAARPARQDARLLLRAAAVPRLRARDGGKLGVGRGAALPAGEGRGVRGGAGRGGARGIRNACSKYSRAFCVLDGVEHLKEHLDCKLCKTVAAHMASIQRAARRPPEPSGPDAWGAHRLFLRSSHNSGSVIPYLSGLCHMQVSGGVHLTPRHNSPERAVEEQWLIIVEKFTLPYLTL